SQAVVDLMGSGMKQVFSLQPDVGPAKFLGQALGVEEGCRASRVVLQQVVQFIAERGILACRRIRLLQLFERRHEYFGNVAASVRAKVSQGVGNGRTIHVFVSPGIGVGASRRAASMKPRTRDA